MANMPHMPRREGDEFYCPRCGTRWDAREETPDTPCVEDRREKRVSPLHRTTHSMAPLTPADTAEREQVERIWRETYGHPDFIELAASDAEWRFYIALMNKGREDERNIRT